MPAAAGQGARYQVDDERIAGHNRRARRGMRPDGGRAGRDVQFGDDALEERDHLARFLCVNDGEARDRGFIRRHDVDVDVSDAEFFAVELQVNALPLPLFLGRTGAVLFGRLFVLACDRYEVLVQDVDNFRIGERTRPQAKGPPSTPAGIDIAVIGEQEDGSIDLGSGCLGGQDAGGPADFIEAPLRPGGLDLADLALYGVDERIVFEIDIGGGKQSDGKERQF